MSGKGSESVKDMKMVPSDNQLLTIKEIKRTHIISDIASVGRRLVYPRIPICAFLPTPTPLRSSPIRAPTHQSHPVFVDRTHSAEAGYPLEGFGFGLGKFPSA
jgi:hypothetical protein